MSTRQGKALHLQKRLLRVVTALDALARHPAASDADRADVQQSRHHLIPIYLRLRVSIMGERLAVTAKQLTDECLKLGIIRASDCEGEQ